MYKQILINAILQIGKRAQKTELTGRSPLRRGRSAVDWSAIEEEEGEGGAGQQWTGVLLKKKKKKEGQVSSGLECY